MKQIFLSLFLLLVISGGCTRPPEGDVKSLQPNFSDASPGMVRIKLNPQSATAMNVRSDARGISTGLSDLDRVVAELGATRIERSFEDSGEHEWKARQSGLDLWYDLYFEESTPVSRAYEEICGLSGIDVVEPDYDISIVGSLKTMPWGGQAAMPLASNVDYPFDDPLISIQWSLHNNGTHPAVAGADINALTAWRVTSGASDIIVAVVDGGVDFTHEDLAANMWQNQRGEYGYNFVDGNATIIPHDHGTHVAGTIAAVNNNGRGVAGVAGGTGTGDGVRIMSCQIYKTDPNDYTKDISARNVHEAIRYGANNGAVISQNSWGYVWEDKTQPPPQLSQIHKDAIDYFITWAGTDGQGNQTGPMNGGIVIFAAGNDNTEYKTYPAAYERVISVGAMSSDYQKAGYSNYGDWVTLSAPGGDSRPYVDPYTWVLSTLPNNQYGYMQGTSMACPHVAGVAALVIAHNGGPGFTTAELGERLRGACRNIDKYLPGEYEGKMGLGYIDAAMALMEDSRLPPAKVGSVDMTWKTSSVDLSWRVTADGNGFRVYKYDIYISKTELSTDADLAGLSPAKSVVVGGKDVGDAISTTLFGLTDGTSYYVAIVGEDIFGNTSQGYFDSGTTVTNHAPVRTGILPDMYFDAVGSHQQIDMGDYFTDPDGDELTYTFETEIPELLSAAVQDNKVDLTVLSMGKSKVTVTATDLLGKTASGTYTVFSRDGSQSVEVFPNPVVDNINFRVGPVTFNTVNVAIYSGTGAKVMERSIGVTPYEAAPLNLSGLRPGNYSLVVRLGNEEIKRTIVKL